MAVTEKRHVTLNCPDPGNNTIEARDVKLGDRFDQNVEILEGVEDGEKVAVSQLTRLDTGAKVTVAKAD